MAPPPSASQVTYTVSGVPQLTVPTYSTFMTTATPIPISHSDHRVYPSSFSTNSSSSIPVFSESLIERSQPILQPSSSLDPSIPLPPGSCELQILPSNVRPPVPLINDLLCHGDHDP